MSNNINPLKTYKISDPRLRINNEREFAIQETGMNVTQKIFLANNASNTQIQYTTPPPSPSTIIDRKIYMLFDVTLTLTGTGNPLLLAGRDAPRAFPFNSIISTMSCEINGQGFSFQPSSSLDALLRYNNLIDVRNLDLSLCPSMLDNISDYTNATDSNRNPLGMWQDDSSDIARGAYPYEIIANGNGTAQVRLKVAEPVFISPLIWGRHEYPGLIGVQTMNFSIVFGSFDRIWSRNAATPVVVSNVVFNALPGMLFNYITPKPTFKIPSQISYTYYRLNYYPTSISTINAGTQQLINSANIQFQSVPKRIFLYARTQDASRTSNTADFYLSLENLSINFNNKAGILSAATKEQLYQICVKNGYSYSWNEWSGNLVYARNGTNFSGPFPLSGSVMCIEMEDLGLDVGLSSGVNTTIQFFVTATIRNNNPFNVTAAFYIIGVDVGTITIQNNMTLAQVGVASHKDVIDNEKLVEVSPLILNQDYGGNFLSGLKSFGERLLDYGKKVGPIALDVAKTVGPLLPLIAAGDGRMTMGGIQVGGHLLGDTPNNYTGGDTYGAQANQYGGKKISKRAIEKRVRSMK